MAAYKLSIAHVAIDEYLSRFIPNRIPEGWEGWYYSGNDLYYLTLSAHYHLMYDRGIDIKEKSVGYVLWYAGERYTLIAAEFNMVVFIKFREAR